MEILNQFGINPMLLAAQVVNFLLLLFILKKFAYGPILKVLDERKKTIADSLLNAEEIKKKLILVNEDVDKILAETALEAQKVVDEAKKGATEIIEDSKIVAQSVADKVRKELTMQFEQEKGKLEQSVREGVAELVFMIVQKVTGKILTNKDRKRIAQESIKILRK